MDNSPTPVSHIRRGSGEPLVLIHGLGSQWQAYEAVIDDLTRSYDVIAVDLPGFGGTPLPTGFVPGAAAYGRWLQGWLSSLGIEQAHLVGNSMGGGIALEMARHGAAASVTAFSPIGFWHEPGRIWCQVLLTALRVAGRVGGPAASRALGFASVRVLTTWATFGRPARMPADAARHNLAALVAGPAFEQARHSFTGYAVTDDAGLAATPVTVAWGSRDLLLTYRTQSRRARRVLPGAVHVRLRHCGHVPFYDDPAACAAAIRSTTERARCIPRARREPADDAHRRPPRSPQGVPHAV